MSKQLRLLDTTGAAVETDWRLDEATREIGRSGVAAAREALRQSRPRYAVPTTTAA